MEIINKSVRDLVPYENNPRNNDEAVEYVAASIREFGFKVPIVIDRDGVIVAGHTRLKAALKLGLDEVPCIVADDLTPEQVAAFRLADNKVSEQATWAEDKLVEELKKLGEFDMTKFGFDAELTEKDPEDIIQDEVPVPPRKAKSKLGQIYQLGRHRLIVGDSTDPEVIDKLMDGATADLWITDPPYNVALGYNDTPEEAKKRRRRTDGKVVQNDQFADEAQYINFLVKAFEVVRDHLRAGGSYYVWHASTGTMAFVEALQGAGFQVRQHLTWIKDIFVLGRQDYQWRQEGCLYGWKDGASHYFIDDRTQGTVFEIGGHDIDHMSKEDMRELLRTIYDLPSDAITCERPKRSLLHPTMKPVQLIAKIMKNSSRPGEIVIDTFGGSGTTLIAAEQLGRTCYTAELDPCYADVIIQRWEELTGEQAELVNER